MRSDKRTLLLLASFALTALGRGFSQTRSPAEEIHVTTNISLVGHSFPQEVRTLYLGPERIPAGINTSSIFRSVDYTGSVFVPVYLNPLRPGTEADTPLCVVQLSEHHKEVLILLLPDSTTGMTRCKSNVVNISSESFPPGSRMLANLTPVPIRGQLGKAPYKLNSPDNTYFNVEPGRSIRIKALEGEGAEPHAVKIEYYIDPKWRTLREGRWFRDPDKIRILFFFLNPDQNRVLYKTVNKRVQ